MTRTLNHQLLGRLKGAIIHENLVQFRSLPYASIPRRFARSELLHELPKHENDIYNATQVGPSAIQPYGSAKSDAKSNQLPTDDVLEQEQSEDYLRVTITRPIEIRDDTKLPVVVFLHGGAFFLGSGDRQWLSPIRFCLYALELHQPVIFASVNYRLGLLGFLHSPEVEDLMPPNNGLHDQLKAFEWIHANIAGFGGDPENITAIGQSAGGESLSLHNLSGIEKPLYRRSIMFSGTLVTMPPKSHEHYESTFLEKAREAGINVEGQSSQEVAEAMINLPVDKVRDTVLVGAPCPSSEILPYEWPTMQFARSKPKTHVEWLESQIVSSCTYDGSISCIMTTNDKSRHDHAASFMQLARKLLQNPNELFSIYDIHAEDDDPTTLRKICQFESDIGFISAALAQAAAAPTNTRTLLQIFDLGNPFEGMLTPGDFATHTWDIVALLGAYEDRLSHRYVEIIRDWRKSLLNFIVSRKLPSEDYATIFDKAGIRSVSEPGFLQTYPRLDRLRRLGEAERGEEGLDFLWEGVCRRWLDKGE